MDLNRFCPENHIIMKFCECQLTSRQPVLKRMHSRCWLIRLDRWVFGWLGLRYKSGAWLSNYKPCFPFLLTYWLIEMVFCVSIVGSKGYSGYGAWTDDLSEGRSWCGWAKKTSDGSQRGGNMNVLVCFTMCEVYFFHENSNVLNQEFEFVITPLLSKTEIFCCC